MSVLLGRGDGTFAAAVNYFGVGEPFSVAVGDFTGTGILDLAVANGNDNSVSVLLGHGDGTIGPAVRYGTTQGGSRVVAVGDFNGDGILNLAVTNPNNVNVLLGNGDGSFRTAVLRGIVAAIGVAAPDDLPPGTRTRRNLRCQQ